MSRLRWLFAILVAVAFAPVSLLAQEPAVVSGRVTNASGGPENAVLVRIEALSVGTTTGADGSYRLVVPASRVRAGQTVTITASRVGYLAKIAGLEFGNIVFDRKLVVRRLRARSR